MLISTLIESLSEKAVITPLTSSSVIIFDKNELKVYVGFTNNRETVEYSKEVVLLLSTEIPKKAEIREIIVSKNGDYVLLEASRSVFVVRINSEILVSKPDRLQSEVFCECYPLHDALFLQNSAISVVKSRILSEKLDENTLIAAVLYSDNCIRFYNLFRKSDSLLLTLDFRHLLHQETEENLGNNTFGLHKSLVSFDLIPPQPKSAHFSLIAVDSDTEFFASFVHFSCFKEGILPRIHRLEIIDGLPCDPLDLRYIQTSNPKISSVFVLVSGGGVISHLILFADEFGEFKILINDQLRLPDSTGDPKIIPNRIKKLNTNRYTVATSTCLFSVNISPWFDAIASASYSNQETRVVELVNAVLPSDELSKTKNWTSSRSLRAISVQLNRNMEYDEDDVESDSEDVMHLVILENRHGGHHPMHVFSVSTFENSKTSKKLDTKKSGEAATTMTSSVGNSSSLEQQLAQLKPFPRMIISDKIDVEDALTATQKYLELAAARLKKHSELAKAFVERSLELSATAQALVEKQQSVDERLVEETSSIEDLKMKMSETKLRSEAARKAINVLFHRVEENVPLSDNEVRIFERLKDHQKMLSDMSISAPKMALDSNELLRMADSLKRRGIGSAPNKMGGVEKNSNEIDNLSARELKLRNAIVEFAQ